MRLTLSALLCAAALSSPALAHGHDPRHDDGPPPYGADMPPPPGYDGPGYGPYGGPMPIDPRMNGEWVERCGHREDRGPAPGPDGPYGGCGYPAPYGYPGAYMTYGVPVIMVPVLRNKPCKEVVEYVEEVLPVRRRAIPPRIRPAPHVVPDKRLPMDKRVPMAPSAPSKRISY